MDPLPKYLTQDGLTRFFAVIDSPRDRALFGLIYRYGLRVGEALLLTVDAVRCQTHRITIRRLKNGLGGEKPLWRHTAKLIRRYVRSPYFRELSPIPRPCARLGYALRRGNSVSIPASIMKIPRRSAHSRAPCHEYLPFICFRRQG